MVTPKPDSRSAATSRSSQAILSREYCHQGLRSGVDSVTGRRSGGVWYAEAELMNTYWPVRPVNRSMSVRTWSGVKATQSTTASNSRSPSAARTLARSRMSPCRTRTPSGTGRAPLTPRLSRVRSMPRSTASRVLAELMTPLPPMNRTRRALMSKRYIRRHPEPCRGVLGEKPADSAGFSPKTPAPTWTDASEHRVVERSAELGVDPAPSGLVVVQLLAGVPGHHLGMLHRHRDHAVPVRDHDVARPDQHTADVHRHLLGVQLHVALHHPLGAVAAEDRHLLMDALVGVPHATGGDDPGGALGEPLQGVVGPHLSDVETGRLDDHHLAGDDRRANRGHLVELGVPVLVGPGGVLLRLQLGHRLLRRAQPDGVRDAGRLGPLEERGDPGNGALGAQSRPVHTVPDVGDPQAGEQVEGLGDGHRLPQTYAA